MAVGERRTLSLHPLLRKAKAATLRLSKQARAGLQRLVAGPRSLERLLLFSIAGTVLFAILAIALASFGLLRDQAQDQALARVRAAAHAARYEIRRVGESTPVPGGIATTLFADDDRFWVVDANLTYRLRGRRGMLNLTMHNLLDEEFNFQDLDPENPRIMPERLVSFGFTLAL